MADSNTAASGSVRAAGAPLVRAEQVRKYFPAGGMLNLKQEFTRAVDGVSLDIMAGETFGLVGESGCGKSTFGRALIGLFPLTSGRVVFDGADLALLRSRRLKDFRARMQIVFQDPGSALNPRITIGDSLLEPFVIHHALTREERRERIQFLIERVGLSGYHLSRYPHELSGGQKQRVGIARALALNPALIICDEAVSALDVSIQAQVINLLADLQKEFHLTYLFISHNLSVVHHVSNRVGVMYLGKLVESGSHADIFERPRHPYTKALLSAIPGGGVERIILSGDVPSPAHPPAGCRFHTRCPQCRDFCRAEEPPLEAVGAGHYAACHLK
ncbi:MAG: ATP-binding cassette domain-containing protein [Spirochaetaceae bacterium]|nr:ATP-binding cassette domain-containing protein [Spirochaetaceae bacterium]